LPVKKVFSPVTQPDRPLAGVLQMKDKFKEGDVVVVIFPDHGTRYLGKMYNDDWLRDRGFLKDENLPHAISSQKREYRKL
jgi:cystathionine beta-synthase